MTVAQDETAVETVTDRLTIVAGPDGVALAVAAGFGLVAAALVGVATALALAAGAAGVAVGIVAALAFAATTIAVFEAGRRTGSVA